MNHLQKIDPITLGLEDFYGPKVDYIYKAKDVDALVAKLESKIELQSKEIRSLKRLVCIIRYYFIIFIIGVDVLVFPIKINRSLLIGARDYWKKKAEEYK